MSTGLRPEPTPVQGARDAVWAPRIGLAVAFALILASAFLPTLLGWEVYSRAHPEDVAHAINPLHGWWEPQWFGPGTLPALLLAGLGVRYAVDLGEAMPWRRLLVVSYLVGLAWMLALALVSGRSGLAAPLANPQEYLDTARSMTDVPAALHGWIDKIPMDAPDNWATHVAGHPPLATLFFVALARVGLAGDLTAGLIVTVIAASTAPAVLVALRALGAEVMARRAAPFLALTPAAVFMAVSADAVFTATAAWGIAALAVAAVAVTTRQLWVLSVVAGLLLGASVMMSYGLPLLALLAVAVLVAARSWWPLPIAGLAALAVVLAFAVAGFAWWEAYPVLRERYYDGVASMRPGSYWTWANLGSLMFAGGPMLGAGVATLRRRADRVVVLLAGAGVLMVLAATLSQMSRAEVERIWLPFVPWLTISLALLPERWRRGGLALQVLTALLVEHLLYTSW